MNPCNRRAFLQTTAGVAAGLAGSQCLGQTVTESGRDSRTADEATAIPPPPRTRLGKTGIETSRLAQGTGVHGGNRQSDQTRLGFEKLVGLFHHAYDRGIRFFDLADLYGTHLYFREALRQIPRDEVTILSKIWWRYDGPEEDTHRPERKRMCETTLERFRHELNTDVIDVVLLHCMMDAAWPTKMQPYMDVLSQSQQQGRIRAMGVSCHTLPALQAAATSDWVQVILARINPKGVLMDGSTEDVITVLKQAKAAGKTIIGMKILGEGKLASEREACLQFAQKLDFLDAMSIGFDAPGQIDDILTLMARFPATNGIG